MSEHSTDIEPTRLVIKHLPTQAEIDAFVQAIDNCFIDTAVYDATMALARNTGTEQNMETIFEKLANLTA